MVFGFRVFGFKALTFLSLGFRAFLWKVLFNCCPCIAMMPYDSDLFELKDPRALNHDVGFQAGTLNPIPQKNPQSHILNSQPSKHL